MDETTIQALDRKEPDAAAVAGARRESRLRVQAQRQAELLRGVRYCDRRSVSQDGAAPNKRTVRSLSDRCRASEPKRREIHVSCDNQQQNGAGRRFLNAHRHIRLYFTPTYSSRLNQVENWFSRIQHDVTPAASSLRLKTWIANSCTTSVSTAAQQKSEADQMEV
ncbi:transposase [Caballeronia arvi]|uniref:transposase n=1 Tax=Caballeronia arvi TaxID=1777135 RepID=UPI001356BACB